MHEYLGIPNMLICVEGKGEGRKEGEREASLQNVTHSHWKGLLLATGT